jgi:hypothetical protein
MKPGPVEQAIRRSTIAGDRLATPSDHAPFVVAELGERDLVLLFGGKRTRTALPWPALEELGELLSGHGWVIVGQTYRTSGEEGTVDGLLKRYIRRATANWVVAVLAQAQLVDVDIRPLRVRWRAGNPR